MLVSEQKKSHIARKLQKITLGYFPITKACLIMLCKNVNGVNNFSRKFPDGVKQNK